MLSDAAQVKETHVDVPLYPSHRSGFRIDSKLGVAASLVRKCPLTTDLCKTKMCMFYIACNCSLFHNVIIEGIAFVVRPASDGIYVIRIVREFG